MWRIVYNIMLQTVHPKLEKICVEIVMEEYLDTSSLEDS